MAWAREKALVSAGFQGQGDWNKSQRAELASSSRGKVKGYAAAEIHGRNRCAVFILLVFSLMSQLSG